MIAYTDSLQQHYERHYSAKGTRHVWKMGPVSKKLHPDFHILAFAPHARREMWTYATVGMSADRDDDNLIELICYAAAPTDGIIELLTINASFHRNTEPLGIHHTVNIGGKGIAYDGTCDHGFISLPYLEGEELELFNFNGQTTHICWFIPITERERDFKVTHGCEALEQLFENNKLNYLNLDRPSLI